MNKRNRDGHWKGTSQPGGGSPAGQNDERKDLDRVIRYAENGNYQSAIALLRDTRHDPQLCNAMGVCLMRVGRVEEAVRILRDLVLQPGCTWMIPNRPIVYKTNFATALLMSGRVSGCVEMLAEINREKHPSVIRLRMTIRRWERGLSFWQRLNWRLSQIDPANRPVELDFAPGDFADPPAPQQEQGHALSCCPLAADPHPVRV